MLKTKIYDYYLPTIKQVVVLTLLIPVQFIFWIFLTILYMIILFSWVMITYLEPKTGIKPLFKR